MHNLLAGCLKNCEQMSEGIIFEISLGISLYLRRTVKNFSRQSTKQQFFSVLLTLFQKLNQNIINVHEDLSVRFAKLLQEIYYHSPSRNTLQKLQYSHRNSAMNILKNSANMSRCKLARNCFNKNPLIQYILHVRSAKKQ